MPTSAIVTLHPVWDCRWSRPGHRLTGVADTLQPEGEWVCVREGERRTVHQEECAQCSHWEPMFATGMASAAAAAGTQPMTAEELLEAGLRGVLVLIAIGLIAVGFTMLTSVLAIPFTILLWLCAAAIVAFATFARFAADETPDR